LYLYTLSLLDALPFLLANIVIDYFLKGGPIMYPILVVAIVAVCVVGERAFWWWRLAMRRDPATLEKVLAAMEAGDFKAGSALARSEEHTSELQSLRHL